MYIASARAQSASPHVTSAAEHYTGDTDDAASHAWVDAWLGSKSAG